MLQTSFIQLTFRVFVSGPFAKLSIERARRTHHTQSYGTPETVRKVTRKTRPKISKVIIHGAGNLKQTLAISPAKTKIPNQGSETKTTSINLIKNRTY